MFLIGMLIWGVLLGLYLTLPLAASVLAIVATLRGRGRAAISLWGLALWLTCALALTLWLNSPMTSTFEFQGFLISKSERPAIVEDFGSAVLMSFGATSPLFLVPLACALFTRKRSRLDVLPVG